MRDKLARVMPQPLIGMVTLSTALLALAGMFEMGGTSLSGLANMPRLIVMGCLLVTVIVAHRYPIHIRHHSKLYVCTIPLYLMAALLPPVLATASIGAGILGGQLLVRSKRGNRPSDIATTIGRWMIVGMLGSVAAHLPVGDAHLRELPLLLAAAVLWAGDILTCPLTIAPMSKESPQRIIVAVVRQAGLAEAAQNFCGLVGALLVDQVTHPGSQAWALLLLALPTVLVYRAFRKQMDEDTFQLLEGMADAVDLRDKYTGGHSQRVAALAKGILRDLHMEGPEAQLITIAARLHDIGKIGIPDHVLKKDCMLTPEEQELMQTYPERGAELLRRYQDFARGIEMVRYHHERWDGGGYPNGLKELEIPFGARIIAVADSYDAMTSDRPYRRALSPDMAAAILLEGRGKQWDATIVDAFLRTIGDELRRPAEPLGLYIVGGDRDQIARAV